MDTLFLAPPGIEAMARSLAVVLEKTRHSDRIVEMSGSALGRRRDLTTLLADNIVSTTRIMDETIGRVRNAGHPAPMCIRVRPGNRIEVSVLVAAAVSRLSGTRS